MNSSTKRSLVIAVTLVLALGACKGKESAAQDESTATIAPAQPQPVETGTDAMTQTIELGDGRSVSEGGSSEEGTAATATTTVDPAAMPMTENPTTTTASTTTR